MAKIQTSQTTGDDSALVAEMEKLGIPVSSENDLITPEQSALLLKLVLESSFSPGEKAFYTISIVENTLTLEDWKSILERVEQDKQTLKSEINQMENEVRQLEADHASIMSSLKQSLIGAALEWKEAAKYIVKKAFLGIEKSKRSKEEQEIERLRKNIKNKQ